ncbi:MAG TPA: 4'-phosphopantetheinyl transferase superfamily protein [Chitinophagaceae bacterium]|nr:4'-phosphopantetheinyl transferase superfamily protein [Chitinophagaceae bacterium]
MEEKAKEIISLFVKVPVAQINETTIIDRSAVNSSIVLHRMYGKLADAGIVINNYQNLRSFGELQQQLNGNKASVTGSNDNAVAAAAPAITYSELNHAPVNNNNGGIGIDIEMVSAMPLTDDFREDNFYTMNFSATEIAYSILQPSPYASFAGLFAAKEAMVKADNQYKGTEFKNIVIQWLSGGKPVHPAFTLSISHTPEIAVAVAVPVQKTMLPESPAAPLPVTQTTSSGVYWWLLLLSLVLSVTAIFLIARKN